MKNALIAVAAAALLAACAAPAESTRPTPATAAPPAPAAARAAPAAPAGCAPAPTQLVVKDLQEGRGDPVTFRTAVMVHYTGWLYDGCKPDGTGAAFDTSISRGVPFGLVVGAGRVIKGWDEGLIGLREGGKRLLVIPPDKGYGAAGSGSGRIPPNATLVFEVELVKVLERPQAQPR